MLCSFTHFLCLLLLCWFRVKYNARCDAATNMGSLLQLCSCTTASQFLFLQVLFLIQKCQCCIMYFYVFKFGLHLWSTNAYANSTNTKLNSWKPNSFTNAWMCWTGFNLLFRNINIYNETFLFNPSVGRLTVKVSKRLQSESCNRCAVLAILVFAINGYQWNWKVIASVICCLCYVCKLLCTVKCSSSVEYDYLFTRKKSHRPQSKAGLILFIL